MKIPNIIRVDIVDNEPQEDIGRVLATYYLVNPDKEKLEEIKKRVESRFETEDDEPTVGCICEIEDDFKNSFEMITLDTVEIEW